LASYLPPRRSSAEENRQHERTPLQLPGQLYLPAEQTAQSCTVTDISAGGARVTCEDVPPARALVILHVEGFGRFEAVTTNFRDGALGMRFLVPENRRGRLARQIDAFLLSGIESAAQCGVKEQLP
jgi:hypothetical protein